MTVTEAAEKLGVSPQRVRAMIASGLLAAKKNGRDWVITAQALAKVQRMDRKPGRPRK